MKQIRIQFILVLLASLSLLNYAAAGCGDSKAECYLYKDGKLITNSACTITECSNMSNYLARWYWEKTGGETAIDMHGDDTTVNGKPGFDIEKGKLDCYGINQRKAEIFCTNH